MGFPPNKTVSRRPTKTSEKTSRLLSEAACNKSNSSFENSLPWEIFEEFVGGKIFFGPGGPNLETCVFSFREVSQPEKASLADHFSRDSSLKSLRATI